MAAFELIPASHHRTASLTRRGAGAGIAGVALLTMSLFTNAPLLLLILVSFGGMLVLAGALAGAVVAIFGPFRGEV
jgi:hypothetical protein